MTDIAVAQDTGISAADASPVEKPHLRTDIQGLRGIAVLLVIAYHANYSVPGGFIGVDVFFVISGFVIYNALSREIANTGSLSLIGFFGRRIRRLLPALALTLVTVTAVSVLIQSPLGVVQATTDTAGRAAVSLANFQLYGNTDYFAPSADINPLLHTWSLSVEEQFYLVFPALVALLLLMKFRRPGAVRLFLFAVIAAVSLALSVLWTGGYGGSVLHDPQSFAFFSPFTRAFEFLAGVLLARAAVAARRLSPRAGVAAAILGITAVAWAAQSYSADMDFPGKAALVPVLGTALLIVGGGLSQGVYALLSVRPLRWLGDISYGLYLWHWPFIVFSRTLWNGPLAIALLLSLGTAGLSYRYLEQPIRVGKRFRGTATIALAVFCLSVPLVAASKIHQFADNGAGLDLEAAFVHSQPRKIGCHGYIDKPIKPLDQCTFPAENSRGLILLFGDSHASAIADAVIAAGNANGYDVGVQTRSACPFQTRGVNVNLCDEYQATTLQMVKDLKPDVVVIANRASSYSLTPGADLRHPIHDAFGKDTTDHEAALQAWEEGLRDLLTEVTAAGSRVVLVANVPEFYGDGGKTTFSMIRPNGKPEEISVSAVQGLRQPTMEIDARLAAEFPGVTTLDPLPVLCDTTCSQRPDDVWLYLDRSHLTVAGASLLEPLLSAAFSAE